MMKKLFTLALALIMLVSLCACGSEVAAPAAETADSGLYPKVTAAVSIEIQDLKPTNGNGNPKTAFYCNIYESLFDFNSKFELVPNLAQNLEIVDETHWRVTLFNEIYDSAGNHITASDVVFATNWLIDAGEALNYDLFESVEALNDYTLLYTWKSAPASTSDVEFPFVRTFIFAEAAFDETRFATAPVATGNYVVKEFVTGSSLVLEANPNYWADKTVEDVSMRLALHHATVQEIDFQIIQESATAQVALQTNMIDYCDYIRAVSLPDFENDEKYVVDVNYSADYSFLGFNMDPGSVLADDINLRLAIAYALDSEAIAGAMPGSFTGMKTYGTPYFADYNTDWESDETYCNTCNVDLAKDYLAKSDYAAAGSPEIVLISKSVEADQNAVQMMQTELLQVGINVKLKPVDASTFQTDTTDPANWDLVFFNPMGGKDLVSSWKLVCSNVGSKTSDGKDNASLTFNTDEKLFELYDIATADATRSDETLKDVIDYLIENAYVYPVAYGVTAQVYKADVLDDLYHREGYVTLAASTYKGQPENADSEYTGFSITVETGDPAELAGSYTFTETVGEGSGTCEYTLTLNADGTYRLDQHNMYGEDVYIEGSFTNKGGVADCAAPEAGVQGAMDRLLTSGWANADAPAAVWTVNADGTAVPQGYDPNATAADKEAAASGEEPAILANLEGAGFERFDFWEVNEQMGRTFHWHVMKSDGMIIVIQENELAGTDDGLLVYHYANNTEDKGMMHLDGLDDGDKDLPRLGGYWNEDGSMDWQIFGAGLVYPVNMEGADAYKDAVNAGEIPAKEEAAATEEPGILAGLAGMGFDRFDWTEESPVGSLPWHLLIKNGDKTPEGLEAGEYVLVVENPNLGTPDGLLVYHGTFTKEGPTINLSTPDETDEQMKRLGGMWNTDGTSVWMISGAGVVAPQDATK